MVGRQGEPLQQEDIDALTRARIECLKSFCLEPSTDILTIIQPPSNDDFAGIVRDAYAMGARWFLVHRHPNRVEQGLGHYWTNGKEFAEWWIWVRDSLAEDLPEAKWGVPAMRPCKDLGSMFAGSEQFFADCSEALERADFFEIETRWRREDDIPVSLWRIDSYQRKCPHIPAIINFCNTNANVAKDQKAGQYLEFYNALKTRSNIMAGLIFCVSSPNPNHKFVTFRGEGRKKQNGIPAILGDRKT